MSNIIKFAILLIVALLIAMIVRVVVASASKPSNPVVTTEKVFVSSAALPQGLLLRDEDITWEAVPTNGIPPNAILGRAGSARTEGRTAPPSGRCRRRAGRRQCIGQCRSDSAGRLRRPAAGATTAARIRWTSPY